MFEPDDLLLALRNAQVEFVVIGGVAVGVHNYVRATKDLDIVPDPSPENMQRLACLLVEIDAQQMGVGDFSPAKRQATRRTTTVRSASAAISHLGVA